MPYSWRGGENGRRSRLKICRSCDREGSIPFPATLLNCNFMNTQEFEKKKQEVLDSFDFDKVHKVMKFLNWKWFNAESSDMVPSISELRDQASDLLDFSYAHNCHYGSGGFMANVTKEGFVGLIFKLEWSERD